VAFKPAGSTVTVKLNVPVVGVVHGAAIVHAGETWSQLVDATEKVAAAPAPDTCTTWDELVPPTT
jgi:hypothetical protein